MNNCISSQGPYFTGEEREAQEIMQLICLKLYGNKNQDGHSLAKSESRENMLLRPLIVTISSHRTSAALLGVLKDTLTEAPAASHM